MYHRVHSPVDGRIVSWRYIPGRLYPGEQPGRAPRARALRGERARVDPHRDAGPRAGGGGARGRRERRPHQPRLQHAWSPTPAGPRCTRSPEKADPDRPRRRAGRVQPRLHRRAAHRRPAPRAGLRPRAGRPRPHGPAACSGLSAPSPQAAEPPLSLAGRVAQGGGQRLQEALARPFLGAEAGEVLGVHLAVDEADAAARPGPAPGSRTRPWTRRGRARTSTRRRTRRPATPRRGRPPARRRATPPPSARSPAGAGPRTRRSSRR